MAGSLPEAFQRLGMVLFHTPAMEKTNTGIGNSYRVARFGGGTVIVEGLCVQTGGKRQRNKQGKKSFHRTQCNYYTVQIKKIRAIRFVTRIFSNRIAVYLSYSPARNSATSSSVEFMT